MGKKTKLEKIYHNSPCLKRGFHRLVRYICNGSNIEVKECIDCGMWGYV